MTEFELRSIVVEAATKYIGVEQGDEMHHFLVDLYNSHKPLARGYKLKYTDAWCAGFVSAIAIMCGLTDIIPTEVGAQEQLVKFQKMKRFDENDARVPKPGDICYYCWSDNGVGDNTGRANHVGIVADVYGDTFVVVEGNMSMNNVSMVGLRKVVINDRYLRGFGIPDYATKAATIDPHDTPFYKYVDCDYLNLRRSPSMDAGVIAAMPYGAKVVYHGEMDGWAQVDYDSMAGYCGASYLAKDKPVMIYRTTDALRMRAKPTTLSKTLKVLPRGSLVYYTGNYETSLGTVWREVVHGDFKGWMSNKYLEALPS